MFVPMLLLLFCWCSPRFTLLSLHSLTLHTFRPYHALDTLWNLTVNLASQLSSLAALAFVYVLCFSATLLRVRSLGQPLPAPAHLRLLLVCFCVFAVFPLFCSGILVEKGQTMLFPPSALLRIWPLLAASFHFLSCFSSSALPHHPAASGSRLQFDLASPPVLL